MCRCKHLYSFLLVVIAVSTRPCQGRVVTLREGQQGLIEALRDETVDRIVLDSDYSVASELSPGNLPVPVAAKRNVIIEGRPGVHPPVSLDLAFRRAGVALCSACNVTLRNLTLRNARRGSGAALDFFVGDDDNVDSAVLLQNVYRHRLACTPGSDAAEVLTNTPRSKILPPSKTGKQVFHVKTITFEGVTYPDALHLVDFTQDFPLTHQEGRGHTATAHFGGYALGSKDVVYLCEHLVSESCLAEKQPDACVNELIDSLISPNKQQATGLSGPLLAAIIVPIVVVGALLTALALWIAKRRRRQRQLEEQQQAQQHQQHKIHFAPSVRLSDDDDFCRGNGILPPKSSGSVSAFGLDSASDVHSVHSKSHRGRRSLEVAMQPRGCQDGWQLVGSATADFVQPPVGPEEEVEFGSFLGAGSYGRVYRASWAGRDVACKVIMHDKSTLQAVEAEADLMLLLNHPNVVKAFHYRTFTYIDRPEREAARRSHSRGWSQAGGQRPGSEVSQSSGGSSGLRKQGSSAADMVPQLGASPYHLVHHTSSNSGSGNMARVVVQQQEQQQQQSLQQPLKRQESHDVLVTNLSLGPEGVQEAGAIAASLAAASSVATKGSAGTEAAYRSSGANSGDDRGLLGSGDGGVVKLKAETWLVQEYCDLGTLGGIASSWDTCDECDEQMLERLQLLRDTALGLEELHNNHVVHGDVNARNVLVSSSSSSSMCAKVADLGLARCLAHHATHRTTNSCGTMSHMAPELLRYGRLSPAVDIYAFGIMMWECYSGGQQAFDKLHYGQFFETVVLRKVRPCVPAGMPPDYELLMRQCWAADPADRPSVAVLHKALQLMMDDRQQRVQAAAAAITAAAAAAADGVAVGHDAAARAEVSPPGVDVLPALQAMLPQKQRGPSPAGPPTPQSGLPQPPVGAPHGAPGPGSASQMSPNNSSTPLSVVSLSALFPDNSPDHPPETVLIIGEQGATAQQGHAAGAAGSMQPGGHAAPSTAASNAGRRTAGVRDTAVAGSPLSGTGDLESQLLEKDQSVHNNRLWFV